jgi:hypothetical protein
MSISASPSIHAAQSRSMSNTEQAYRILHLGFIVAPIVAGLDKFLGLLADWTVYVPTSIASALPFSTSTFMMIVGVIEMAAGVLVATKPKIGAYVVAAWLGVIIINLLILGSYLDVALRDLGLMLGALALAKLSADRS